MANQVLNRDELIGKIWANKGKVGLVAEILGVTPATIYNYAKRYSTVKNALVDSRVHFDESLVDAAEIKLHRAVVKGEAWAVKYTLDNKGKSRGYGVSSSEIKHSGSIDVRSLSDDELEALAAG